MSRVIIIGGGAVGMIMAIALAKAKINVTVLEKSLGSKQKPREDGRVFAIASESASILNHYDIWDKLADFAGAIEQIRVSDNQSLLHLHFANKLVNGQTLGFMLEHDVIIEKLHEVAANYQNLQVVFGCSWHNLVLGSTCASVSTNHGELKAELIIAADGRNSSARTQAGIGGQSYDYQQTAMVCNLQHEHHHQNIAQERFLPAGPFAILPMQGGYHSSIVWTEKTELAPLFLNMPKAKFMEHLGTRFTGYLGELSLASKITSYPLSMFHAVSYTSKRLALIGDAAHAIHPIAGQGLNLAIRDIEVLVGLLTSRHELGLDLGSDLMLAEYEQLRRRDNKAMIAITTILNQIFANNYPAIKGARRLGLAAVNQLPALQKLFMQYAMGKRS